MRDDARTRRQEDIAAAAYRLLADRGYAGTSMLAIAKAARASNETLYRWYGDKAGLFTALIEANTQEVRELLESDLATDRPPVQTLAALGPRLLALLVSDRAISLNRAAAADASGELGAALAKAGRGTVGPLIAQVFARAHAAGNIAAPDSAAATRLYLDLLVGDLQIRRAIGALPALTNAECQDRADLARSRLLRLLAPQA